MGEVARAQAAPEDEFWCAKASPSNSPSLQNFAMGLAMENVGVGRSEMSVDLIRCRAGRDFFLPASFSKRAGCTYCPREQVFASDLHVCRCQVKPLRPTCTLRVRPGEFDVRKQ
jgi:hypothetical protein